MTSLLSRLLAILGIREFVGPTITETFTRMGSTTMPFAGTATVTLSPPDPRLAIARRTIKVVVGGDAPILLDGIDGPVTFACNESDSGTITAQDVTKGGIGSTMTVLPFTALDMTTVPPAPTIGFSFVVNPPAPAPAAA